MSGNEASATNSKWSPLILEDDDMSALKRRYLLNHEIMITARKIAHGATKTCRHEFTPGTDLSDEHTPACTTLKNQIVELAMQIKLAGQQRPDNSRRRKPTVAAAELEE